MTKKEFRRVVEKGYGHHLYEFMRYHDSIYERYNKNDGLTKCEIRKLLKKWEND